MKLTIFDKSLTYNEPFGKNKITIVTVQYITAGFTSQKREKKNIQDYNVAHGCWWRTVIAGNYKKKNLTSLAVSKLHCRT